MAPTRMSRRRVLGAGVLLLSVLGAACAPAPAPASQAAPTLAPTAAPTATVTPTPIRKREVSFGVTASTSSHYLHFVAKTKIWNEFVPEVNVTVVAAGSTTQNAAQMATGQFDLTSFESSSGFEQYNGVASFQGKAIPDMRIVFNDVDFVNMIMVREDSGITSLRDLDGKAFNPGIPGSAVETSTKRALELLGIQPNYFAASFQDAVTAIQNKRIVGYVKSTAVGFKPDATMLQLAAGVKMRTIGFSKAEFDQILVKYPMYTMVAVPKGVENNFYGDGGFMEFSSGLGQATMKSFPEDLVYKMVKAVFMRKNLVEQAYEGYSAFDLVNQTVQYARIPLHAGTVKYLKEIGVKVPDALIPPEAK